MLELPLYMRTPAPQGAEVLKVCHTQLNTASDVANVHMELTMAACALGSVCKVQTHSTPAIVRHGTGYGENLTFSWFP